MIDSKKASACAFIFNDRGELLLQLRAASDNSYPSHYDFSAAGNVEPGESPGEAVNRELMEEIGIKTFLSCMGEDEYEGEKMYLYKGLASRNFNLGAEIESVRFVSISEVHNMIEIKKKFHPEFLHTFKKYFSVCDSN